MFSKVTIAIVVFALGTLSASAQSTTDQLPNAPSSTQTVLRLEYSASTRKAPTRRAPPNSTRDLPNAPSYASLTDGEKFRMFMETSRSPLTLMSAGVGTSAQYAMGNRMYGDGPGGLRRSYGASLATKESNAFFGSYLFPTLLNQDPRYHPSESTGTVSRAFYAASRVVLTRSDAGARIINSSYLMSTVVSSSLANAYKPAFYRTFGNTASDIASQIGSDAGMNVLREFWPQLREGLTRMEPSSLKRIRTKIQDKFSDQ